GRRRSPRRRRHRASCSGRRGWRRIVPRGQISAHRNLCGRMPGKHAKNEAGQRGNAAQRHGRFPFDLSSLRPAAASPLPLNNLPISATRRQIALETGDIGFIMAGATPARKPENGPRPGLKSPRLHRSCGAGWLMPRYDFRTPRLFVDAPLVPSATFALEPDQINYLVNVLRRRAGDRVLVFNGRDGEWQAVLAVEGRKRVSLAVAEQTRSQPPRGDLHYLFAPLKAARLDYMVQKAVEMGATRLQPVFTRH